MIHRSNCLICSHPLTLIYTLKDFPVYMGIQTDDTVLTQNMDWATCTACGCVQLKNLIDPVILYKTQHNPAIGKTWEDHNKAFSEYIVSSGAESIIDIGGANQKIAKLVVQSPSIKLYTIVDASVDQYQNSVDSKIKTIKGFIENVKIDKKVDTIILSHTFEHFYKPVEVLSILANFLTSNGKIIISVPNIENQLKDNFTNALNFEHTFYINSDYIEQCAIHSDYKIIDITHYSKYNTFYTLEKGANNTKKVFDRSCAKQIFMNYISNLTQDVERLNSIINSQQVYCFGGHIFTQALLAAGLNRENIISVLDNDPNKIGHVLYGTGLRIEHPSVIANKSKPYIILRTAQYTQEIKQKLQEYNSTIVFL